MGRIVRYKQVSITKVVTLMVLGLATLIAMPIIITWGDVVEGLNLLGILVLDLALAFGLLSGLSWGLGKLHRFMRKSGWSAKIDGWMTRMANQDPPIFLTIVVSVGFILIMALAMIVTDFNIVQAILLQFFVLAAFGITMGTAQSLIWLLVRYLHYRRWRRVAERIRYALVHDAKASGGMYVKAGRRQKVDQRLFNLGRYH